jgi:hypothetical protein
MGNVSFGVLDMKENPTITYTKHTFLSSLVMGFTALVITIIISSTVLIIYGTQFAGDKSEKIISLVRDAMGGGLPNLRQALPPALADVLDDRRQLDYDAKLSIHASTTQMPDQDRTVRTKIEVVNKGSEVISLLCLRIVVFGPDGEILTESSEWAATPIAAELPWRGLLMPGSHRYFVSSHRALPVFLGDELKTEVEITDLRVWNPPEEGPLIEGPSLSEAQVGNTQPIPVLVLRKN